VEALSTDPDGRLLDEVATDNSVDIDLTVLFPDLLVAGSIRHPSSITGSTIVTISAEIKNDGDIDASNVIVTFYVDGKEVKTQTITKLPKGSSRLVPFTWQSMSGEHKLTIKVDPDNVIVESDENNNEKTKKVDVKSSGFSDIFNSQVVCSILPLIIVAVLIAVAVIWLKKKGNILGWKPGRASEETEYEEEG
jgi:subtilase family serine protease